MKEHLVESSSRAPAASTTMTVEEMAREAGFDMEPYEPGGIYAADEGGYDARDCTESLNRFAALVRAQALEVAAADARDAKRYRWLRGGNAYAPEEAGVTGGVELDELCDSEYRY